MALTLGFLVLFVAGVAAAYFVGLNAARSTTPTPPNRSPVKNASDFESKLDPEVSPVIAPGDSNQAPISARELDAATGQFSADEKETADAGISETRRFQRSEFCGTAVATIYPPKQQLDAEPVRCEVQTRDLCCSGIGIAHTQRLLPQQMIILEAVGKVLVSEVRWCRRIDKNLYVAGCRLIKTTT
jgi:hypothetical protein